MNEEKTIDLGPTSARRSRVEEGEINEDDESLFIRGTIAKKMTTESDEKRQQNKQQRAEQSEDNDDESNSDGDANNKRNINVKIGAVVKDTGKVVQKGVQQVAQGVTTQSVGKAVKKLRNLGQNSKGDNDDNHDEKKEHAMAAAATTSAETFVEENKDEDGNDGLSQLLFTRIEETVESEVVYSSVKTDSKNNTVPIVKADGNKKLTTISKKEEDDDDDNALDISEDEDSRIAALAPDLTRPPRRFQTMVRKRAQQQAARLGIPSASAANNSSSSSNNNSPKHTTSPKTNSSNLINRKVQSLGRILGPRPRGREEQDDGERSEPHFVPSNLTLDDAALPSRKHKYKKKDAVVVVAAREPAAPTASAAADSNENNEPASTSSNAVVSSAQQTSTNGVVLKAEASSQSDDESNHSSVNNNKNDDDATVIEYHDDATVHYVVCTVLSLTVACFQTWRHWSPGDNRLPLSVTVAWMVCAYIAGSTITHITAATSSDRSSSDGGTRRRSVHVSDKTPTVVIGEDDYIDVAPTESLGNQGRQPKKNGPSKVISYVWSKVTTPLSRNKRMEEHLEKERQRQHQLVPLKEAWTMLNPPKNDDEKSRKRNVHKKRFRLPKWQRHIDPLQWSPSIETDAESVTDTDNGAYDNRTRRESSNPLMQKLLSDKSLSHIPRRLSVLAQTTLETTKEKFGSSTRRLGDFTRSVVTAYTLDDYVIDPFLSLRGMDVFTNSAEGDEIDESLRGSLGSHPWFIQNGLRAVPTLIINILFSWGNIVVYFEMPAWVTNFQDALVERPDDTPNVKALKRFLTGSDDYCNDRLKCIPSVVTGPLAVRMLAPPKREVAVHGAVIPLTWHRHDADNHYEMPAVRGAVDYINSTSSKVKKLCPVIECELDCMSGRAIRSMAGLVKRHLSSLVVDLALVIGGASEAAEDADPATDESGSDPHACLGMWRFNHIDIASCPEFPDRTVYAIKEDHDAVVSRYVDLDKRDASDRRDILVASRLSVLDSDELKAIMAAEEE